MTESEGPGSFRTTRWSLVFQAGQSEANGANPHLGTLCTTYARPLYAWLRRRGHSRADADDLLQGFFTELLQRGSIARADPKLGRFRAFLLGSLTKFVLNQRAKDRAQKRGGGQRIVSLDCDGYESSIHFDPADPRTPDDVFSYEWAVSVLGTAIAGVQAAYTAEGKQLLFEGLRPFLNGDGEARSYREVGHDLHMTEGAIAVAVSRLRGRLRQAIRDEVANTLEEDDDIDSEMADLFTALKLHARR